VLRELHIAGLGVIEDLTLEPHPGLTVLSGETGAGKTLVASGLSLALGARANAQHVRSGSSAARIQARFDAVPEAEAWVEEGEVVLDRTVRADGRSSARIGGQIATVRALGDLGQRLAEVHGQHQSLRLLEPATQTGFLDRFAGADHLQAVERCRRESLAVRALREELAGVAADARDRARELDLLAHQIREISEVEPMPSETPTLELEAARLGHAERLQELTAAAIEALGAEGAATEALAAAAAGLGAAAELDGSARELAERAHGLAIEATELAREVRGYGGSLALDPGRLQAVRERIGALRALQRKYGADDEAVLAFRDDALERSERLTGSEERAATLEAEVAAAEATLGATARQVTQGRGNAAPRLRDALKEEIAALGMEQTRVEVSLQPAPQIGPAGAEVVQLSFAGGAGQPLAPLASVASGGELSRVMLACRSVLADLDEVHTLVFDEVDAGIGGTAGLAVGARLARLARTRQVIVVSHLPQIACFADLHVLIHKDAGHARVTPLDEEGRVAELSRMLAGMAESRHARSHAQELLAQARDERSRPVGVPV
jgi:DNA repair protein RecN (Recombination protein N)